MTRRLPKCAHCGKRLPRGSYVIVTATALKGRPMAAWCLQPRERDCCADADRAIIRYRATGTDFRVIAARGPGRVLGRDNHEWPYDHRVAPTSAAGPAADLGTHPDHPPRSRASQRGTAARRRADGFLATTQLSGLVPIT